MAADKARPFKRKEKKKKGLSCCLSLTGARDKGRAARNEETKDKDKGDRKGLDLWRGSWIIHGREGKEEGRGVWLCVCVRVGICVCGWKDTRCKQGRKGKCEERKGKEKQKEA